MKTADYKSISNKLKFEGRAYINGKYVDAIDGAKFENINPATGETLCSVAKCNHKDVDVAVKVARKYMQYEVIWITIFVMGMLGLLFDVTIRKIIDKTIPWRGKG